MATKTIGYSSFDGLRTRNTDISRGSNKLQSSQNIYINANGKIQQIKDNVSLPNLNNAKYIRTFISKNGTELTYGYDGANLYRLVNGVWNIVASINSGDDEASFELYTSNLVQGVIFAFYNKIFYANTLFPDVIIDCTDLDGKSGVELGSSIKIISNALFMCGMKQKQPSVLKRGYIDTPNAFTDISKSGTVNPAGGIDGLTQITTGLTIVDTFTVGTETILTTASDIYAYTQDGALVQKNLINGVAIPVVTTNLSKDSAISYDTNGRKNADTQSGMYVLGNTLVFRINENVYRYNAIFGFAQVASITPYKNASTTVSKVFASNSAVGFHMSDNLFIVVNVATSNVTKTQLSSINSFCDGDDFYGFTVYSNANVTTLLYSDNTIANKIIFDSVTATISNIQRVVSVPAFGSVSSTISFTVNRSDGISLNKTFTVTQNVSGASGTASVASETPFFTVGTKLVNSNTIQLQNGGQAVQNFSYDINTDTVITNTIGSISNYGRLKSTFSVDGALFFIFVGGAGDVGASIVVYDTDGSFTVNNINYFRNEALNSFNAFRKVSVGNYSFNYTTQFETRYYSTSNTKTWALTTATSAGTIQTAVTTNQLSAVQINNPVTSLPSTKSSLVFNNYAYKLNKQTGTISNPVALPAVSQTGYTYAIYLIADGYNKIDGAVYAYTTTNSNVETILNIFQHNTVSNSIINFTISVGAGGGLDKQNLTKSKYGTIILLFPSNPINRGALSSLKINTQGDLYLIENASWYDGQTVNPTELVSAFQLTTNTLTLLRKYDNRTNQQLYLFIDGSNTNILNIGGGGTVTINAFTNYSLTKGVIFQVSVANPFSTDNNFIVQIKTDKSVVSFNTQNNYTISNVLNYTNNQLLVLFTRFNGTNAPTIKTIDVTQPSLTFNALFDFPNTVTSGSAPVFDVSNTFKLLANVTNSSVTTLYSFSTSTSVVQRLPDIDGLEPAVVAGVKGTVILSGISYSFQDDGAGNLKLLKPIPNNPFGNDQIIGTINSDDSVSLEKISVQYNYTLVASVYRPTNKGILDFTFDATRTGLQGLIIQQNDGSGRLFNIGVYDGYIFTFKKDTIFIFRMSQDDLSIVINLPYRKRVGIPSLKSIIETAEGLVFMNTANNQPELTLLQKNDIVNQVQIQDSYEPNVISRQFDFKPYDYTKCSLVTVDEFIGIFCKKNAANALNDTLLLVNRLSKEVIEHTITSGYGVDNDNVVYAINGDTIQKLFVGTIYKSPMVAIFQNSDLSVELEDVQYSDKSKRTRAINFYFEVSVTTDVQEFVSNLRIYYNTNNNQKTYFVGDNISNITHKIIDEYNDKKIVLVKLRFNSSNFNIRQFGFSVLNSQSYGVVLNKIVEEDIYKLPSVQNL